jgi:Uma2 family endonuclease
MIVQVKPYTVREFEQFTELPENANRLFEFIGGEIVEVPSHPYVSSPAAVISGFLFMYLLKNTIGHITGEAGGYEVSGERYAPDVACTPRAARLKSTRLTTRCRSWVWMVCWMLAIPCRASDWR